MAATSIYAFFHLFAIEINKRPVHNQVYGGEHTWAQGRQHRGNKFWWLVFQQGMSGVFMVRCGCALYSGSSASVYGILFASNSVLHKFSFFNAIHLKWQCWSLLWCQKGHLFYYSCCVFWVQIGKILNMTVREPVIRAWVFLDVD